MKLEIKNSDKIPEPILRLYLSEGLSHGGSVNLLGSFNDKAGYIIATVSQDGTARLNRLGCQSLGLKLIPTMDS